MAINTYAGLQGSGKSFEFVSGPMLDAVEAGRRVITNVAGVNQELVHQYLVDKRNADPEKLGEIVYVPNDRIKQACFFPDEEKPELSSLVQGGDLVAIDEAWRFWGQDEGRLSHEHMQFFRMHRHYVHPKTGVTCDVVLMTQDVTGLHRSVKNVIEFTFKMHKLKSLGMPTRYRVEIYEGWKINSKTRISDRQKSYDPEIFPLYKSYQAGQGQERAIDSRQNIFANKLLWYYLIGTIVCFAVGGTATWKFFHPADTVVASTPAKQASGGAQTSSTAVASTASATPSKPVFSEKWRYAGQFSSGGVRWVVVADPAGRLRLESPSAFAGAGMGVIGHVDGERVSRWTGVTSVSHGAPAAGPVVSPQVMK